MHAYLFKKYDTDGDGMITKAEYFAFIEQRFEKMDLNGDGTVTKDELYAGRFYTYLPELALAVFRDSDTNKNGQITKNEMVKSEKIRFAQMDQNSDDMLSKSEFLVNDMREFMT